MDTTPYWIASASLPRFARVDRNLEVDVVVIGGGIMGLTPAYLLKQAGRRVAVLERDRCARIDTGHTTAHLTAVTDLSRQDAARTFGREAARAVWAAGSAAIDQIVTAIRAEDIACDFRWVPGYLHTPLEPADDATQKRAQRWLEKEAAACRILGVEAALLEAVPYFDRPGIRFAQQALFHPRKYLAALAAKIPGSGSHIFEHSEAGEIEEKPLRVRVADSTIHCTHLVLATHNPLMGVAGPLGAALFQSKLALYSSYAIGAKIPAKIVPVAAFWDTAEPYNYLRVERKRGHDYAIFGGEDHKTGQKADTPEAYRRLEKRLVRFIPGAEVDYRWSGQVIDTADELPYIGELAEKQFGATGFAGNGMTFGTVGAMMATDWVLGRRNPWTELFAPGRKKVRGGAWTYLKENKDYPYYMLRDWVGGAEGKSLRVLKKGQGKVLHLAGRKVAAFRDDEGKVTLCSPVCTHLKCIVGWNAAERTWDCPCHGSRFKPTGELISGPAEEPLEKIQPSPEE